MALLPPRQVHLDFHTSREIPDVGADFDPAAFAGTAAKAGVSSMTVFARCHHGLLYYDSKLFPERIHPHLARKNMLSEQVRALHGAGIKAPVYITVQWDLFTAQSHPEWLIRKPGGAHEGDSFLKPGFYQSLCVNTEYRDFLFAQTQEVLRLLGPELDGLFFDIVGIRPCWCAACRGMMRAEGVDAADDEQARAFAKRSMDRFKAEMTALVRRHSESCSIFYNAGHVGPCTRESAAAYTHFELESLPSGGWGYLHFPVAARYARTLGIDCMGMTGKFHTSWGDFHSLKNDAALEFECFRMLSYGFACSIGDQLPPQGSLNQATYRLIGRVFHQLKQYEPWARPSEPLVEAALLTCESPLHEHQIPDSVLGAAQLLEELSLQFDIVDEQADLTGYRLVLLPDDFTASGAFQGKLDAYVRGGGSLLACHKGGMGADGRYPACFGASCGGDTAAYPDFLLAEGPLANELEPGNEYAIYRQGVQLTPESAEVILQAAAPYFGREGEHFCSHMYTPSAGGEPYPAATQCGNVILFAHPLFSQYRDNAPQWVKRLIRAALDRLLPDPLVRHDGPSTLSVQMLAQPQENRVCAHVLSYIPVRKSASIDIVEDRTKAHGVSFRFSLPAPVSGARLVPGGEPLPMEGGRVTIPVIDGYAVIELSLE